MSSLRLWSNRSRYISAMLSFIFLKSQFEVVRHGRQKIACEETPIWEGREGSYLWEVTRKERECKGWWESGKMREALPFVFLLARIPGSENLPYNPHRVCRAQTTSSPPFFLRDSRASGTRARVKWFSRALAFRSLCYPWGKMGNYS